MNAIWTEKFRPQTFVDVKGQRKIVERIEAFVKQKNMPHLLLAGPPGTGKTSLTWVIVRQLYGEDWRQNFLDLNASVTGDTPILIKENGSIKRVDFNYLAERYYSNSPNKRELLDDIEILSIGKDDLKVNFSKADYIFRHKADKIVDIKYEGGNIKTSLNHSIIVFDEEGNLIEKKCEELKKGDLLITFKANLAGSKLSLDLREYKPIEYNQLRSGLIRNPKINHIIEDLPLTDDLSWAFGLYTAEGCTSFNSGNKGGQFIYTLGYPHELEMVDRVKGIFSNMNISTYQCLGKSGFDRSRESSVQLRVLSTQLAKFLKSNFYSLNSNKKTARTKRVFSHIFNAGINQRVSFLKGYFDGDGCGEWGKVARISSVSKDCLIDVAWLGKISGIETSYFGIESRLIWENSDFTYIRSNLLPSDIFTNALKYKIQDMKCNPRYILRHQLYSKKCKRIKKSIAKQSLDYIPEGKVKDKLLGLINSDLYVVKITGVKVTEFDDYVYDVSVPGTQMFFGGTNPILLHNSDDRGIDVIRNTIKDFAKIRTMGDYPFKIIHLDESDSLTKEAQQALRRTMENYASSTRFILSANFSSKIIDPIQSRCTVFRFKPLSSEEVFEVIDSISKKEDLSISQDAKAALFEIAGGDVRRLINILQSCSAIDTRIDRDLIYSLVSAAEPKEIKEVLQMAASGDFINSRNKLLDVMLRHGLAGMDVIRQIQKEIQFLDIGDERKARLVDKCGEIEFRMVEGSDEFIQLEALLANFVSK